MVIDEANPCTPSVCLSVSQPSEVAPGSNVCGPFAETGLFTTNSGQAIQARQQLGPSGRRKLRKYRLVSHHGRSAYNALQASLQYTGGHTSLLVAYTYSKAMDDSSAATEQVMPLDPRTGVGALSAFNVTQNLVASYSYELPFDKISAAPTG